MARGNLVVVERASGRATLVVRWRHLWLPTAVFCFAAGIGLVSLGSASWAGFLGVGRQVGLGLPVLLPLLPVGLWLLRAANQLARNRTEVSLGPDGVLVVDRPYPWRADRRLSSSIGDLRVWVHPTQRGDVRRGGSGPSLPVRYDVVVGTEAESVVAVELCPDRETADEIAQRISEEMTRVAAER